MNTMKTVASIFPDLYYDCCQNTFNFKKLEGEKKLKFQESQALTCDYFDSFPTSGWHDLNYLGKVFVAFYGIVQGSEPW